MKDKPLTPAQERFARECSKPGVTQSDAFRIAYPQCKTWKEKSIWEKASATASKVKVSARINELRELARATSVMEVTECMERLSVIARCDPRKFYRPDGSTLLPHQIDDLSAQAIAGIETVEQQGAGGTTVRGHRIKLIKSTEAISKLLEHHHRVRFAYVRRDHDIPAEVEERTELDRDLARRIAFALTKKKAAPVAIAAPVKKEKQTA